MASRLAARRALEEGMQYWNNFVQQCISQRLETDRFTDFVRLVYAKHPLQPFLIADFFLRPQPHNDYSVDPRIPLYVQVLSHLKFIDAPSILKALYIHSALHGRVAPTEQDKEKDEGAEKKQPLKRWKSSSWSEEMMFYHVIKTVVEGTAFKDARGALDLVSVICKWMDLFVAASAADLVADQQDMQAREEMEVARAAFVPLLLRLTDNIPLLQSLEKSFARKIRKELSTSLGAFVQTLQPVPQIIEKLESFRTEVLERMDPRDKKKNAATNVVMDELLDSAAGLNSFVIPDFPINITRAGLYIYLNASVRNLLSGCSAHN